MQKILLASLCLLICVPMASTVFSAPSGDSADIGLIDIYDRPAEGVGAGETVSKQVGITNNGTVDVYVRIEVDKSWTLNGVSIEDMNTDWININLPNINDWVYGSDGYYYYQHPLEPGQTTSDLMNSFTVSDDYKNPWYPGIEGNIIVNGESVAVDGFTPEYDEDGRIIGWGDLSFDIEITVTTSYPYESDVENTDISQTVTEPSSSDVSSLPVTTSPAVSSPDNSDSTTTSYYTSAVTASETIVSSVHTSADSDRSENIMSSQSSPVHISSSPSTGDRSGILKIVLAASACITAALACKKKKSE